jgi:hypothetical protein
MIDDEGVAMDVEKMVVLEDTLAVMKLSTNEADGVNASNPPSVNSHRFTPDDKVLGNYCMEGTFYSGVVLEVDDGLSVVVQYDDGGTTEKLTLENIRSCEPATEVVSSRTSRLSDDEALGLVNTDEQCLFENYDLMAKLAELHANIGQPSEAISLYQEAADLAMDAGKMKAANTWSTLAAELEELQLE